MLEVSTKYALKVLIYLSRRDNDAFIRVEQLSDKLDIPGPYLSKVVKILAKKELLESRRGLHGGIRLGRRKTVTVLDVCQALEDPICNQGCFLSRKACDSSNPCILHQPWKKMKTEILKFMRESRIV